jgi:hypothetical protein
MDAYARLADSRTRAYACLIAAASASGLGTSLRALDAFRRRIFGLEMRHRGAKSRLWTAAASHADRASVPLTAEVAAPTLQVGAATGASHLLGRQLQLRDVDLAHLKHGLHDTLRLLCVGIGEQLTQPGGDHLP